MGRFNKLFRKKKKSDEKTIELIDYSDEELKEKIDAIANMRYRVKGKDYYFESKKFDSGKEIFRIWWNNLEPPNNEELKFLMIKHEKSGDLPSWGRNGVLYEKAYRQDYEIILKEDPGGNWIVFKYSG